MLTHPVSGILFKNSIILVLYVTLTKCSQALKWHNSRNTWRTYSKVYANSRCVVETSHSVLNQCRISHKHAQLSVNIAVKMAIIKHVRVNTI